MNSDDSEDKRRLFEYFIVAGLDDEAPTLPKELGTMSAAHQPCSSVVTDAGKQTHYHDQLAPITDICLIFTSAGEITPSNFERIETTPQGYPANLNHGSLRSPSAFLCYKRGYHKPPLIDLGVLDEGKGEKPMVDAVIVDKTPYGLSANISNSSSGLFFTTRRAKADSPPHQLVITNICVILENKGEHPPHTFYKIPKNLNKSMIGSEVYVCYKKSQLACKRIAYEPAVLDCFPRVHNIEASLMVRNVPMFFLPMGALIEAWPERCRGTELQARTISTCVFTDEAYTKYYGSSITFYEPYTKPLSELQLEKLDLGAGGGEEPPNSTTTTDGHNGYATNTLTADKREDALYYCNKAICIVSRYPFFEPFRRFLYFLLNTAASGTATRIPIERYISHLMYEVPFPSPARPRVLVELGNDMITFESSDDSQTPLTGANFVETLKCLGTENMLYAMLLTLLEQKILVHSLRPWLLTCVSETLCALMFPFSWNLPYIPQCPLPLAGIFHAPLSFMAGVDSRYFDLYEEPPSDVTCFDLDTATISQSAVRKLYQLNMLPKKPLKRLRTTLDAIVTKIGERNPRRSTNSSGNVGADYEHTHARRAHSELAIREAFLRFMCCLMDGYTDFLCPIMFSPWADGATDVRNLFDWERFMQSRDKSAVEFYAKFRDTICFNRFIEERSGAIGGTDRYNDEQRDGEEVSNNANTNGNNDGAPTAEDKSVFYVFFDECIAKLRAGALNGVQQHIKDKNAQQNSIPARLLFDADSMMANRTMVVPAPHLHGGDRFGEFTYATFPRHFDDVHFQAEYITRAFHNQPMHWRRQLDRTTTSASGRQKFFLTRTRQEVRKALADAATLQQQNAGFWPRSVLFFTYTLWFMQLPALLTVTKNKRKMLLLGVRILSRMEQIGAPFHDQVCYRLLMHLCGVYGRPEMAITVLKKMLNIGIIPNAITYQVYHRALLQSKWPSEVRLKAIAAWHRVQLRLDICARFRAMLPTNSSSSNIVIPPQRLYRITDLENLDSLSQDGSVGSDARTASTSSAATGSPSILSFANKMRKRAMKTYSEMVGQGVNDLLERSGLNSPAQIFKEAKLNLSRSFRADQSGGLFSAVSSSDDNLFANDSTGTMDLFDLRAQRIRDPVSFHYWMADLLPDDDNELRDVWLRKQNAEPPTSHGEYLDVLVCSTTPCSNCHQLVYDHDLTIGWAIDDANMNSRCPHCQHTFLPSLKVCIRTQQQDEETTESIHSADMGKVIHSFTVPYISPLVLRRELETLVANSVDGALVLARPAMRVTHPIIFWNLFYYCRQLELPTHLLTWVAAAVIIHCVQDMPQLPSGEDKQQQQ